MQFIYLVITIKLLYGLNWHVGTIMLLFTRD